MNRALSSLVLPLGALPLAALLVGCPSYFGTFDGGVVRDAGPSTGPGITAADIGTLCTYDPALGGNPTNTCAQGLSCLLFSSDGAFIPFPPGGTQNFTLGVWEDQFTRYRQDGIDEGYCTLIGTWQAPPLCPAGTSLKLLATNLAVCMKQCQTAADCGRPGYTCDVRYLDLQGGHCVRACGLDVPDCVRSGQLQRPQPGPNGQAQIALHLAADDLAGASRCDVGTGICAANPGGNQGPGQPCASSLDCASGTVCIQGAVLQSLDPNLPPATPGFCAQPCKPVAPGAQQPPPTGCLQGFACQAGFTFGHGNPLDANVNDANGFLLVSLQDGSFLEAGGFCFPDCQVNGDCNAYPGTQCGAPRPDMFQQPSNGRSMCLIDPLRQ